MDADALGTIPLFSELTLDQRQQVAGLCERVEVDAGATLLREGDFGSSMFGVLSGSAEVVRGDETLRTLGPGDVFGEVAVLSGGRRTASVVAVSPMTLVTIFNRDLWQLERDVPEIARSLRKKIAAHVTDTSATS